MSQRSIGTGFGFVLFLFFGLPVVLSGMLSIGIGLPAMISIMGVWGGDMPGGHRASEDDLAFGGDRQSLTSLDTALRKRTAGVNGGRHRASALAVAVVSVAHDEAAQQASSGNKPRARPSIDINMARAEDSAILVIADRPVVWSTVNAQSWQRGKLAVEGAAVFDLDSSVPDGMLASYRIRAFGAEQTTDPSDIEPNAPAGSMSRFCAAVALWSKYYGVAPSKVRLWRIDGTDRIALDRGHVMVGGRMAEGREYVGDLCADILPPAKRPQFNH